MCFAAYGKGRVPPPVGLGVGEQKEEIPANSLAPACLPSWSIYYRNGAETQTYTVRETEGGAAAVERNIHTAGTGPSLSESGRVKRHSEVAKGNGPDGHGGKLRKTCPLKCGISMLNPRLSCRQQKTHCEESEDFYFLPIKYSANYVMGRKHYSYCTQTEMSGE